MDRILRGKVRKSSSVIRSSNQGLWKWGHVLISKIMYSAFIDSQILSSFYIITNILCLDLAKTWETRDFLFSYLLVRKMVDAGINFSQAILTYLYPLLTYSMPIFTLLLSTTSPCAVERMCQDPSGPVPWEVKDCLRQQHTEAEKWCLLKHRSWFTVSCQVGSPADQSGKYPECGVWVYVCAQVYFNYPPGRSLNQHLFQ